MNYPLENKVCYNNVPIKGNSSSRIPLKSDFFNEYLARKRDFYGIILKFDKGGLG